MAVATDSDVTISWEHAQPIQEVMLEMRKEGTGLSWQEIAVLPAGEKQYTLEIGNTEYDAAYLRISDNRSPSINSISGLFGIKTPEYLSTRLPIPYDYGAFRLFHRNIDGWSFLNTEPNLWPFEKRFPDFDTFCAALTEDFCYNSLGFRKLTAISIWRTMQLWGWQGSCSGFSASSLLFFNDHMFVPAEFPGHTNLYSVPVNEDSRRMLNALQIRFLLPVATDFFKHFADNWNNTPIKALEVTFLPDDRNAGTVIYNDIMIAGNTRQRIVPPWDDLPMEPMPILIDGNLDGVFDASRLASGVYIYRLQAGGFIQSRKLQLVK